VSIAFSPEFIKLTALLLKLSRTHIDLLDIDIDIDTLIDIIAGCVRGTGGADPLADLLRSSGIA
jgi:hypothetical protein